LIFKEFFVPMSLEVGRIIRGSETPSTVNFIKIKKIAQVRADALPPYHPDTYISSAKTKAGRPTGLPASI